MRPLIRTKLGRNEYHGLSKHPLYRVWSDMKNRCYNHKHHAFLWYGGRNISVCDEWKNSAKQFIQWAFTNGWKLGLEIDRQNNNGNYEPLNCRFVTVKINGGNKRRATFKNKKNGLPKGVRKKGNKFYARIRNNYKQINLGHFDTIEEAAIAYENAVKSIDMSKL